MLRQQKTDNLDQCARIGRDIGELDQLRQRLTKEIRILEESVANLRSRIADIDGQIANIQFAEDVARSAGSRGGIIGGAAGEVTAQTIRFAMQRDPLERQKQRLQAERSGVEREFNNKQREFELVDHNFNQLNSDFASLNCPLGLRVFPN